MQPFLRLRKKTQRERLHLQSQPRGSLHVVPQGVRPVGVPCVVPSRLRAVKVSRTVLPAGAWITSSEIVILFGSARRTARQIEKVPLFYSSRGCRRSRRTDGMDRWDRRCCGQTGRQPRSCCQRPAPPGSPHRRGSCCTGQKHFRGDKILNFLCQNLFFYPKGVVIPAPTSQGRTQHELSAVLLRGGCQSAGQFRGAPSQSDAQMPAFSRWAAKCQSA